MGGKGEQRLLHSYYEKPITSKLVLMEKSALCARVKMVVMSQEVIRRMRNTSTRVDLDQRAAILSHFMTKMARSGYGAAQRMEVLRAGCTGYYRMRWRERTQGRRVNRAREDGAAARATKKLLGATSWFRSNSSLEEGEEDFPVDGSAPLTRTTTTKVMGQGIHREQGPPPHQPAGNKPPAQEEEVLTVMFVPMTPGSKLRRALQDADNRFAKIHNTGGVRMVEMGGTKLSTLLVRADPWGGRPVAGLTASLASLQRRGRQVCVAGSPSPTGSHA